MPHRRRKKAVEPPEGATPVVTAIATPATAVPTATASPASHAASVKPVPTPALAPTAEPTSAACETDSKSQPSTLSGIVAHELDRYHVPKPLIQLVLAYLPKSVMYVFAGNDWGSSGLLSGIPGGRLPHYRHIIKYDPTPTASAASPVSNSSEQDAGADEAYLSRGVWSVVPPQQLLVPDLQFLRFPNLPVAVTGSTAIAIGDRHVLLFDGHRQAWIMPITALGARQSEAAKSPATASSAAPYAASDAADVPRVLATKLRSAALAPWAPLPFYPQTGWDYLDATGVWVGKSLYVFHAQHAGEWVATTVEAATSKGKKNPYSIDSINGTSFIKRYDSTTQAWINMPHAVSAKRKAGDDIDADTQAAINAALAEDANSDPDDNNEPANDNGGAAAAAAPAAAAPVRRVKQNKRGKKGKKLAKTETKSDPKSPHNDWEDMSKKPSPASMGKGPAIAMATWVCLKCTFMNKSKNKNCEMCNAVRPPPPTSMVVHVAVAQPGGKDETLVFDSLKPASTLGYFKDILENKSKIPFNDQIITHHGEPVAGKDDAKLNDLIFIDPREIISFRLRSSKKQTAAAAPAKPALVAQNSADGMPAAPGGAKVPTAAEKRAADDALFAKQMEAALAASTAPATAAGGAAAGGGGAAPAPTATPIIHKSADAKDAKAATAGAKDSKVDRKAAGKAAHDDWGGADDTEDGAAAAAGGDEDWGDNGGAAAAAAGGDDWSGDTHSASSSTAAASTGAGEDDKVVEVRTTAVLNVSDITDRQRARAEEVKEVLGLSLEACAIALRHFRWQKQALLDAWMKDAATTRVNAGVGAATAAATASTLAAEQKAGMMDCYLCGSDEVPLNKSTALSCLHRFCDDCYRSWVNAEFDKGPTSVFTKCMDQKCKTRVPDAIQLKFLPREKAAKFKEYILTNFVDGSKTIKWCPTANCHFAAEILDTALIAGPIGAGVECKCGSGWCWKCKRDDHQPASCDQCEQWGMKNSSESENALWILANTKICPKCKVHIEKNQGCNHMTCRSCKHEFCWLCKANWAGHSNCALYDFSTGVPKPGTKKSTEEAAAENAKNSLNKYIHYFNRFDNHQKAIKFAEKTRMEADVRAVKLQSLKGVGAQAVSFLLDAVNSIIRCRRVLQWTYVYAYYLPEPKGDKGPRVLFEAQQAKLEELTDRLHGQSEKPLDNLMNNRMRTDIISLTRSVEKYRKNLVSAIHSIILSGAK